MTLLKAKTTLGRSSQAVEVVFMTRIFIPGGLHSTLDLPKMDYTPQRESVFIDNSTCGMLRYTSVIDKKPNVVQLTIEAAVIISFAFVKGNSTDVTH